MRSRAISLGVFLVFAIAGSSPATAQISTVPLTLRETTGTCARDCTGWPFCVLSAKGACVTPLQELTRLQLAGDSEVLHAFGLRLVQALAARTDLSTDMGNVGRDYYRLVWQGTDGDGKPKAFQLLVHEGRRPDQTTRLNGITTGSRQRLIDILVADDEQSVLHSVYVSTPVANPLLEQIPDVLKKVDVLGFVATVRDRKNAFAVVEAPTPPGARFALYRPQLPCSRADVQVADAIIVPTTAAKFVQGADELAVQVEQREARTSICAAQLAEAYRHAIATVAQGEACQAAKNAEDGRDACGKALENALNEAYKERVAVCSREPDGAAQDPVLVVDDKFRALVATFGQKIARNESKLQNVPDTRYSFALMTAVMVGAPTLSATRVKVDQGKLTDDPLPGLLTMAVVNIHPRPYDAAAFGQTWAERVRFFAGATITPDFGAAAGAGIAIIRGLAVNAGAAWLLVSGPGPGETIGQAPVDKNHPFRLAGGRAFFFGLSYTLK
jgi:hypothetical protein